MHAQVRDLFFAKSCGPSGHEKGTPQLYRKKCISVIHTPSPFPALRPPRASLFLAQCCRPIRKLMWLRGRVFWNLLSVPFYCLCLFLQQFSFLHRVGRAIVSKEPRIIRGPQNRLVQLIFVCILTDFESTYIYTPLTRLLAAAALSCRDRSTRIVR